MVRSSPAEPVKGTKPKGARLVPTMTDAQLAAKRIRNRNWQRAYRIRSKDYVESLERQLVEKKQTIRELEDELRQLKQNMDVFMTSSPFSTPAYFDSLSTGSGPIPSPKASPFPSGDYGSLPDYGQQYVPLPNNCTSWANTVPVPSNVSGPSSAANTDDDGARSIPTSVPASMLPSNNTSSTGAVGDYRDKNIKMGYDVDHHGAPFCLANQSMQGVPNTYLQHRQQSPWNMSSALYY
ncbi:hypothetical protein EDB80DRAFT_825879 [Ilyonectria destructans]|nr:hypothetical protein EDB80DRAFT_825879 [Ilyonectria destructans]